jgi:hypothetical protein
MQMPTMSNMFAQNAHMSSQFANMPYFPNPYMNAYNMHPMPWMMPGMINMYDQSMPNLSSNCVENVNVSNTAPQRQTPKVKVDLSQSKPMVHESLGSKRRTNKSGPKTSWVPKST